MTDPEQEIGWFAAEFRDRSTEQRFRKAYEDEIVSSMRLIYPTGAILLTAFLVVDYLVLPDSHPWPLVLRLGLLAPSLLAAFLMCRSDLSSMHPSIRDVIARCLAIDPSARPTASELARSLV